MVDIGKTYANFHHGTVDIKNIRTNPNNTDLRIYPLTDWPLKEKKSKIY